MTVATMQQYQARTFTHLLNGLDGITKEQLEVHFKLYQGYVTNFNTIYEKYRKLLDTQDFGPEFNEMKRRFAFEFNGIRLHEFYFDNMKTNGGQLLTSSNLYTAITEQFGSFENWQTDFKKTGAMRGIGWAVLFQDPVSNRLFNYFITDHENSLPVGLNALLVMDVWEHAYTVDFKATERPNYIEAFFKNINWTEVETRFEKPFQYNWS